MIIDFHTHTFPDAIAEAALSKLKAASNTVPFTNGTEKGLKESMEKAGVDISVVLPVATNPLKVSKINETSARNNEDFSPDKKGSVLHFGCVHPDCENVERELCHAAELGLRGVKIHPVYQNTCIHDEKFLRILYKAAELDLAVVTHAGDDIGFPGAVNCSPEMIRKAVDTVGDVKLVLAHMGGWMNWDRVAEYLADTKVYLDTSFSLGELTVLDPAKELPWGKDLMDEKSFCSIVKAFGSKRILFGTDSPWSDQSESVKRIKSLPLDSEEKDDIFCQSAKALLKFC